MTKIITITFITFLLCLGTTVHAAENDLFAGDFKLQVYTLKNGEPATEQKNSKVSLFSNAMDTALNRDMTFANTLAAINDTHFQGMSIKAAYSPTANITLHSSVGLTDTTMDKRIEYTERLGWELDLGVAYRFLNKFAYEVHFGYMDTGVLFTESERYTDIEDIAIVTNKLTMSF